MTYDVERPEFIATLRKFYEEATGRESPFHLSPCGQCGGPSFQQPCPLCNYYPMGVYAKKPERPTITCEGFEKAIERSGVGNKNGNIATWLARSEMKTVAYTQGFGHREKINAMLESAQALEGLPSATEIYELVAIQEKMLSAPLAR